MLHKIREYIINYLLDIQLKQINLKYLKDSKLNLSKFIYVKIKYTWFQMTFSGIWDLITKTYKPDRIPLIKIVANNNYFREINPSIPYVYLNKLISEIKLKKGIYLFVANTDRLLIIDNGKIIENEYSIINVVPSEGVFFHYFSVFEVDYEEKLRFYKD